MTSANEYSPFIPSNRVERFGAKEWYIEGRS